MSYRKHPSSAPRAGIVTLAVLFAACGDDIDTPMLGADARAQVSEEPSATPAQGEPDYAAAFPEDRVPRLDIAMAPDQHRAMRDDLKSMLGEFGARRAMGGRPGGGPGGFGPPEALFTACAQKARDASCEAPGPFGGATLAGRCTDLGGRLACIPSGGGGARPPGGADFGLGSVDMIPRTPRYVEAEIRVDGKVWSHVGVRYKGNSSLAMSWQSGVEKLPLRLNFDKFEDDYPEIKNQRFFGFDSLNLSNNMEDPSLVRAKLANDVFRRAGVPAAASAFYRVYLDVGSGPVYLGIYTAIELPSDDAFLKSQFGSDDGNLYKPSGGGARFETYDESAFSKENNTEEADYGDVRELYDALHADRTNPEPWRARLERAFDVDGFLRWLAVNTAMQNWDAYGRMPHNYYLYANPYDEGRLTWIPWDASFALGEGGLGGAHSLGLEEISAQWPLIRYLMDDAVYRDLYRGHLADTLEHAFEPSATLARARAAHALIAPFATAAERQPLSPTQFQQSFEQLLRHIETRAEAVRSFLAQGD